MRFKVVCINDKGRPHEIPQHLWVERDEMYSVLSVQRMAKQPGVMGFVLAEIELPANGKFDSFDSKRFRPATDDDFNAIAALEQLLEEVGIGEFLEV